MNTDIYRIFEAYSEQRNKIINENMPVEIEGGYGGMGEDIPAPQFPELAKGKYDLTPEETKSVFSKFIIKFRAAGGKSPKLYKDFHETELGPIIRSVKPSINNSNAKYTSRVLYNALKAAKVLKDERDGTTGVRMNKKPSESGIEKLAKYTFKKADELGQEDAGDEAANETPSGDETAEVHNDLGRGIDDRIMRRFWLKILGEGDYTREELIRMYVEDNPDVEESDAKMSISSLISTGYLSRTGTHTFAARDPEEEESDKQEEGEGTGEVTAGYDPEDAEDLDREEWGGVHTGQWRGDDNMG